MSNERKSLKALSMMLAFVLCMAMTSLVFTENAWAASKPGKIKKSSIKVTSVKTNSAVVKYGKSKGAKKYQVAYKPAGGKWKYKTTKKRKLTLKSLKAGTKYKVKVRGIRGKKTKGKWSSVVVFTTAADPSADVGDTPPDEISVGATDWMSGIPGERYLNEINIPGAHDAGMKRTYTYGDVAELGHKYAKTQELNVSEQLDAGIRFMDIRISHILNETELSRSPVVCHGDYQYPLDIKTDMRYYALYGDDKLYLDKVLSICQNFLRNHPTETVLLEITFENGVKDVGRDRTYALAKKNLDEFGDLIYKQNGSKIISNMPQLKDVRGKVVILSKETDKLGYGMQLNKGSDWARNENNNHNIDGSIVGMTLAVEDHYNVGRVRKQEYVEDFFNGCDVSYIKNAYTWIEYYFDGRRLELPRNILTHLDTCNIVYTSSNGAPTGDTPEEIANYVNWWLISYINAGKNHSYYYGWIYSDFVTEELARTIWSSNFAPDQEYCNVTYSAGDGSQIKTVKVMKGATVILPENSFASPNGLDFAGWETDGERLLSPGAELQIMEDTTITAKWGMTWKSLNALINNNYGEKVINLTNDITAYPDDVPFEVRGSITLNLNGHTIDAKEREIFQVYKDLTVCGTGKITGGKTSGREAENAFHVYMGAALTLKDGVEISGNHFIKGSIYVDLMSSLTLGDCTITGNTAEEEGAGITVRSIGYYKGVTPKIKMLSGAVVKISGNKVGGEEHNLYLGLVNKSDDPYIDVGSGLSPDSNIGVSVSDYPGEGEYRLVATGTGDDPAVGFTSDNQSYVINAVGGEAHLEPVIIPAHDHELVKTERVEPTCSSAGTEAYWTCTRCNKLFSDDAGKNIIDKPVTIQATGHDWEDVFDNYTYNYENGKYVVAWPGQYYKVIRTCKKCNAKGEPYYIEIHG